MRWRVQLGINSTSGVWKFCQNWTSRRGEFIISMTKLDTSQCQHQPKFGAFLFVFSFSSFVKAKFNFNPKSLKSLVLEFFSKTV
jgi:hypothetical protein